jgi:Bacterial aa3 type cytochrome c oxidase subunit IV
LSLISQAFAAPPLPCRRNYAISGARTFLIWRSEMADHGEVEYATAEGNDYAEHEGTYLLFLTLTKWIVGFCVILLILMAYFLV